MDPFYINRLTLTVILLVLEKRDDKGAIGNRPFNAKLVDNKVKEGRRLKNAVHRSKRSILLLYRLIGVLK